MAQKKTATPVPGNRPDFGITFLGSGSQGNCALLYLGKQHILLDAGLSCRRIERELSLLGLRLQDLDAIFLTHNHGDHVKGLKTLLKRRHLPVHATEGTARALQSRGFSLGPFFPLHHTREIEVGGVRCWPFPVPHDAADPVGFRFEKAGRSMAIATDLGHLPPVVVDHLLDADFLCLESNYDEAMLATCEYPYWLKRRIRGPLGHLPNNGVRGLLTRQTKPLSHLVLVHVSQESNTRQLVEKSVRPFLDAPVLRDALITVAEQDVATPLLADFSPAPAKPIKRLITAEKQLHFDFAADARQVG